MERVNNATYCCNEIELLIEAYKARYKQLCSVGHVMCKTQAKVYYDVIADLEKILYGESKYDN